MSILITPPGVREIITSFCTENELANFDITCSEGHLFIKNSWKKFIVQKNLFVYALRNANNDVEIFHHFQDKCLKTINGQLLGRVRKKMLSYNAKVLNNFFVSDAASGVLTGATPLSTSLSMTLNQRNFLKKGHLKLLLNGF